MNVKAKLPAADRAMLAAHESGGHDGPPYGKPRPDVCRSCAAAVEVVAAQIALPLAPEPIKPAPKVKPAILSKTAKVTKLPKLAKPSPEPTVKLSTIIAAAYAPVVHTTREGWLMAAVEELRPMFVEAGYPVPERVRVSVGWPGGRGKKAGVIGQCWPQSMASDSLHAIFLSPVVVEPNRVLGVLIHELIHASVPKGEQHKGAFVKVAKIIGLTPKWTSTGESPELIEKLAPILARLGSYDHGTLNAGAARQIVQTTRMLKVQCGECGCIIRMTSKWIDEAGLPTCGCGGEMEQK